MKPRNVITAIEDNHVDVCPPLVSMEMFTEKVPKVIMSSPMSHREVIVINSETDHL
jgi:fibronectin type 3 domain-containing protein